MSDWEEEMYDESDEQLSFDEDDVDEVMDDDNSTSFDTLYYEGKSSKDDGNYEEALNTFNFVINHFEEPNNDGNQYIFKSIKQAIKIHSKLGNFKAILELIDKLIGQIHAIDQSYAISSLYRIVTRMEKYPNWFQRDVYVKLDRFLTSNSNQSSNDFKRIRMKIDMSLVNVLINEGELYNAMDILKRLESSIDNLSGSLKGTYLLDIIVSQLTIVMNSDNRQIDEISRLVNVTKDYMTGIPHAKVVGVINEAMGLIAMHDRNYQLANDNFRTSFKGFCDAGDDRKVNLMTKYVVSSLLSRSQVNPFDSNDFHGLLKLDLNVKLMEIYNCVQNSDIKGFHNCVDGMNVQHDYFLVDYLPHLVELIKSNYIIKCVPLMKRVSFRYLYSQLDTDEDDLLKIIFTLYNRGHMKDFKIDFIKKFIETFDSSQPIIGKLDPMEFIDSFLFIRKINGVTSQLDGDVRRYLNSVENGQQPDINDVKIDVSLNRKNETSTIDLCKRFNLLYIPNYIVFEFLDCLGYPNTGKTSWNLLTDPIHIIGFYIDLLKGGIPRYKEIEKSRIEKAELERIDNESKKIYNGNSIESMTRVDGFSNRRFEFDSNIPQVVQFSDMAGIEPPDNPIPKEIPIKKQLEIKFDRLLKIANTLNDYSIENRLLSPGIQMTSGSTSVSSKRNKRSHQQFQQLDQVLDLGRTNTCGPLQSPSVRHLYNQQISENSSQTSEDDNNEDDESEG